MATPQIIDTPTYGYTKRLFLYPTPRRTTITVQQTVQTLINYTLMKYLVFLTTVSNITLIRLPTTLEVLFNQKFTPTKAHYCCVLCCQVAPSKVRRIHVTPTCVMFLLFIPNKWTSISHAKMWSGKEWTCLCQYISVRLLPPCAYVIYPLLLGIYYLCRMWGYGNLNSHHCGVINNYQFQSTLNSTFTNRQRCIVLCYSDNY